MIKIFSYLLQSILIYFFYLIGLIMGLKISRKIFARFFLMIGPIFRSKTIVQNNLHIFSHKVSNLDEKKITKNMWKNYGMTFIEYIFLKRFRERSEHITIKGEKNLLEIIQQKKPVIFVSGHFANFELMSMEITKRNIPLATIYRPLNNIFLNPFMEYLRKKYICQNQIKKGINGVRDTIKYIKKNYSIALMIDQRVSEGEKINFFGKPALTTTLPAQLSAKFKLDIVPVYIERDKKNNFKIEFQKKLNANNFRNKLDLSKELNIILEKMVVRNPNHWIWTHDRWK